MQQPVFLLEGWLPLARTVLIALSGCAALLVLLRIAGKRTLSRMSTFDFILTVTLGAAFGRILTSREVGVLEAIVVFALLVGMQVLVSWGRSRSPAMGSWLDPAPTLLYYRGAFQEGAMRRERVTRAELATAVRKQGAATFGLVEAVVLEPDGRFAVLLRESAGDGSLLAPLRREEERTG